MVLARAQLVSELRPKSMAPAVSYRVCCLFHIGLLLPKIVALAKHTFFSQILTATPGPSDFFQSCPFPPFNPESLLNSFVLELQSYLLVFVSTCFSNILNSQ